jgi:organic hydroperoxide reductase OsmC/OhrA
MPKKHRYQTATTWTGNQGSGTSHYRAYSRNHEITSPQKAAPISGSSDPAFRGDPTRYNPEDLLVGALSACHMLWVLHLCADVGIVITSYTDEAVGEMVEHADGSGEFEIVTLRPRMTITDRTRTEEALALHRKAHELCALARSMNFPVRHEAVVLASS